MEEAELLKERLQAITKKRKIQEDIVSKRLEIDKEKLKLQQLKKKSARDLWLMGGTSAGAAQKEQKAQDVTQQTKALQANIHRIEKEIEALEREELNISTNEGLILNRLKAIEKSTEDIIKAANENFKSEPIHVYSGIPDTQKSLNMRKQPTVDQGTKIDQQKPALFAMEINVQKDLRTGESRVVSTSTVPAQELQQRGIKVYDDGRKSVYALHTALEQPEANGVDELSPKEVEELLKQATEKRKKPQEQNEPLCIKNYQNSHCSEICNMDMSEWPELEYSHSNLHYPYQEIHEPAHMFHHYSDQHEYYHNSNGNSYEIYGGETRSDPKHFYDPRERHRRTPSQHVDSVVNQVPPLSYRENPKLSILNTLPSDEPVSMIFMGYQKAEEDAQSYEGSIQAELVIIGDGEEEALTSDTPFQKRHVHSLQNLNTNNASTHLASETSSPASLYSQTV
ncbi:palmdelphin [Pangasianodon hypophthalmus]|uniref:palmdelphin n=1 Tax=Pangasianodon hypophthalmus TaxID=310915 RepID=UPI0023081A6E|nr:palmdelphin [Pangasianodon hypophthalmus]